jgi:chromatin segregation and condensation protein Rec8/ScpA/Scc1 (kleisin family)
MLPKKLLKRQKRLTHPAQALSNRPQARQHLRPKQQPSNRVVGKNTPKALLSPAGLLL